MQFNLTINCDNAAFEDDLLSEELVRILESVQTRVFEGWKDGSVRDTNGNTVGRFELVEG